jgi:hypothetical protein
VTSQSNSSYDCAIQDDHLSDSAIFLTNLASHTIRHWGIESEKPINPQPLSHLPPTLSAHDASPPPPALNPCTRLRPSASPPCTRRHPSPISSSAAATCPHLLLRRRQPFPSPPPSSSRIPCLRRPFPSPPQPPSTALSRCHPYGPTCSPPPPPRHGAQLGGWGRRHRHHTSHPTVSTPYGLRQARKRCVVMQLCWNWTGSWVEIIQDFAIMLCKSKFIFGRFLTWIYLK